MSSKYAPTIISVVLLMLGLTGCSVEGTKTIKMGETVEVTSSQVADLQLTDSQELNFMPMSCQESTEPLTGGGYASLNVKQGMKFVGLRYRVKNDWVREQIAPNFYKGEVKTDQGYYYKLSFYTGAYKTILPGETIEEIAVFEIPEQQTPKEISLIDVPALIELSSCTAVVSIGQ